MPIRFPCPHCQQKLSISTRRAGAKANCPRCQRELTVPGVQRVTTPVSAVAGESSASPPDDPEEEDNPYSQFAVFDETELVYESSSPAAQAPTPRLDRRISIPRYVLLTQGVLLAVVALAAFALGIVTGGAFFAKQTGSAGRICKVNGTISYASGAKTTPDAGAVVIFLPQTKDPGRRVSPVGLRPDEPLPDAPLGSAEELRSMGGAYTRADEFGRFEVHLADPGTYFVLVLSNHARRKAGQDINSQDLVRISRFVENASDLLAESRYQFSTESVRGDRQFSAVFD